MRFEELEVDIGRLDAGGRNAITDVAGVTVGHRTLDSPTEVKTGVTAVVPHAGSIFEEKVPAAGFVLNGHGKSLGLMQVRELGVIETPIALTNTLDVGTAFTALVRHSVERSFARSVNPVVGECNDGYLSTITENHVSVEDVHAALDAADGSPPAEGAVGAGTGMTCYGFKGGIGTASRVASAAGNRYTVGSLVLSNFGQKPDLTVAGVPVGRELAGDDVGSGGGSTIMLVATDAPLTARQLERVAMRAPMGLARTGSYAEHNSGDAVVAFSTENRYEHGADEVRATEVLPDDELNEVFKATAEATEEATYNSLLEAETTEGRDGHVARGLPGAEVERLLAAYGRLD